MAANVTLANLRTRARTYADERPGGSSVFCTDTELNTIINDAIRELYDLLVAARGMEHYASLSLATTTAINVEDYALPADFYQELAVMLGWADNDWERVPDFQLAEEAVMRSSPAWGRYTPKGFRILGGRLHFMPPPKTVTQVALRYIPAFTDLAADGSTFDGVNGWELLVTLDAAIVLRSMQKLETADLERRRERQYTRIEGLAADRSASTAKRVVDVNPEAWGSPWPERLPRA